jgi:hypothetical protein
MTERLEEVGQSAPVAEELELRVLSGLQSGAALSIEELLIVGAGEDADLLLLDEGVAATQLRIRRSDSGALALEAAGAGVFGPGGRPVEIGGSVVIEPGDVFQAGPIWLAVRSVGDPWEAWIPPAAVPTSVQEEASVHVEATAEQDSGAAERLIGTDAGWAADPADRGEVRNDKARPSRWLSLSIVVAGLLSTIVGVGALMTQIDRSSPMHGAPTRRAALDAIVETARQMLAGRSVEAAALPPRLAESPQRRADNAAPDEAMNAQPPSSEAEAERAIADSRSASRDRLVVRSPDGDTVVLPFDVREVLLGPRSYVVLTDGRRLSPGDTVQSWRLTDIRPGALVFEGPRKVLVPW